MNPFTRLIPPGIILLVIFAVGIAGYSLIEGWSVFDAFYMLVITLSTVGFREVRELSLAGRILTTAIIFTGVGTAIYAAGQVIELIV